MIWICPQSASGINAVCVTNANESAISNPPPILRNGLIMIEGFELLQQNGYGSEKTQQNTSQSPSAIGLIGVVEPLA
jgi:hypothetical protein